MDLFDTGKSNNQILFEKLFFAKTESDIDDIIESNPELFENQNWFPYGQDEHYFGVIESQQNKPIPALVEKITNSIDAVLMKHCYFAERGGLEPSVP